MMRYPRLPRCLTWIKTLLYFHCSADHVRTDDQSRKVGINSFPEIHMYWNGIPYILNGQSSRHSGTFDMVSSTNERFRAFRSLLGKLNVTAEFVVLGRLHLRPLQIAHLAQGRPHVTPPPPTVPTNLDCRSNPT